MVVASPDLDDEFGEDEFVEEFGGDEPSEPWHNSTRALLGASAVGVVVIAVLVAAVMYVSGGDEPTDAPLNFVDPSFSATASESAPATTTTQTVTSTPKISTTEINGPPGPSTTSSVDLRFRDLRLIEQRIDGASSSSPPPPPSQRTREGEAPAQTSRSRPRLNVTRTLGPGPIG